MAWRQVKSFDVQKMGRTKGMCLMNCRLGFGIPKGTYKSAKDDMEAQKKEGTFHTDGLPSNVAVPVYFDVPSVYEHVMVDDHTTFYSDGKHVTSLAGWKILGWGEKCDGVRVVEYVADKPEPVIQGFLPSRGYWKQGDVDARIGKLMSFMRAKYPRYTSTKALGNVYGPYAVASIKEFQKRVGLTPDGLIGPKTYDKLTQCGFRY